MSKRLGIAIALLVLFSTYKPQKIFLSGKFNIQEINIENNYILSDEEIKNDLSSIYNTSLFFLNTDIIKKILIQKILFTASK